MWGAAMNAPRQCVTIRFAASEEERLAGLQIRYQVFTQEQRDDRYADHERMIFTDRMDGGYGRILIALADEKVVGTSRLSFRAQGPFLFDERYCWDVLAVKCGLTMDAVRLHTALWDRGAVLKAFRRLGLFAKIEEFILDEAAKKGAHVIVGVVKGDNRSSLEFFTDRSWRAFAGEGTEWVQIYKMIPNADRIS
jgi:GNAT superfamily N-acetyltransferase